jgi:hypothetical protein
MIERSTQQVTEIMEIKETISNSPRIRRRKCLSDDPSMQKRGVKFITPWDMIWKSVNFSRSQKMAAQKVAQELHHGEHHWINPDNEDQMDEVNVISEGSMFIALKT